MMIEATSIYIGILTLLMLIYGARVSILRIRHQVSMGTSEQADLDKSASIFGNFVEWVPLILVALAACEINGAPDLLVHLIGIALVISRVMHPLGLFPDRTTLARTVSVLVVWGCALVTGGYLIYASLV